MRIMTFGIAALLAAVPGAAAPRQEVPAATPTGPAVDCLRLNRITAQKVRSDKVIDFYVGKQVYRNELPVACPQLGFEERFLHKTTLAEICSTDTITVLISPNMTRGTTCGLGKFQPVTLAK